MPDYVQILSLASCMGSYGAANNHSGEKKKIEIVHLMKKLRRTAVEISYYPVCSLCASVSVSVNKNDRNHYLTGLCRR